MFGAHGRRRYTYSPQAAAQDYVLSACIAGAQHAFHEIASPGVARNEPTPCIGVWKRANIGVFLWWVAAFALMVIRRDPRGVEGRKA
ncbi:MAG TPA: hypothetical protein VN645_10890 [Steroidobacteraceae bacterium]|nr:hypothetical protein [Steroidobacteraceae bacterium]